MSAVRRGLAAAVVAAALAGALAGCSFIGDVIGGAGLTSSRLGVDSALRGLVEQLKGLDQVSSASYDFDAADVSSTPRMAVELTSLESADWSEVTSLIDTTGSSDALSDFPIETTLTAVGVSTYFRTPDEAKWLVGGALDLVARALAEFPGSSVMVSNVSATAAWVTVSADETAEELVAQLGSDPEVAALTRDARASGHLLQFAADGLDLTGEPRAAVIDWTRGVLGDGVPRFASSLHYDDANPQSSWVQLSLSGDPNPGSISANWAGGEVPGTGALWSSFVAALLAAQPLIASEADCTPVGLNYSWTDDTSVFGNNANVFASCGGPSADPASPDRPALATVRDALTASGINLAILGFTLS